MRLDHQRLDCTYLVGKGIGIVSDYGMDLINDVSVQDRSIKVAFDHSLGLLKLVTEQMY